MKMNTSAAEIAEYTEMEKETVFYSLNSVYSVADFYFVMGY